METRRFWFLLALTLMITGLAVFLTILHAFLSSFLLPEYVKTEDTFFGLLRDSRMIKWLVVSGIAYVAGLCLLLFSSLRPTGTDKTDGGTDG